MMTNEEAKAVMLTYANKNYLNLSGQVMEAISVLTTEKTGEWLPIEGKKEFKCDFCGFRVKEGKPDYCPHCGTRNLIVKKVVKNSETD